MRSQQKKSSLLTNMLKKLFILILVVLLILVWRLSNEDKNEIKEVAKNHFHSLETYFFSDQDGTLYFKISPDGKTSTNDPSDIFPVSVENKNDFSQGDDDGMDEKNDLVRKIMEDKKSRILNVGSESWIAHTLKQEEAINKLKMMEENDKSTQKEIMTEINSLKIILKNLSSSISFSTEMITSNIHNINHANTDANNNDKNQLVTQNYINCNEYVTSLEQMLEKRYDEQSTERHTHDTHINNNIISLNRTIQSTHTNLNNLQDRLGMVLSRITQLLDIPPPQEKECMKMEDCPVPNCICPPPVVDMDSCKTVVGEIIKELSDEKQYTSKLLALINNANISQNETDNTASDNYEYEDSNSKKLIALIPEDQNNQASPAVSLDINSIVSPAASPPPPIKYTIIPSEIFKTQSRGVFFIVVGPESSGNRMTVELLLSLGCRGISGHRQPWDASIRRFTQIQTIKLDREHPACAVIHRSLPHNGQFVNLRDMNNQLRRVGYEPRLITIQRDWNMTRLSQMRRKMVPSLEVADRNIEIAHRLMGAEKGSCQDILKREGCSWPWFLDIHYESLRDHTYLKQIYSRLGWNNPTLPDNYLKYKDMNTKYM